MAIDSEEVPQLEHETRWLIGKSFSFLSPSGYLLLVIINGPLSIFRLFRKAWRCLTGHWLCLQIRGYYPPASGNLITVLLLYSAGSVRDWVRMGGGPVRGTQYTIPNWITARRCGTHKGGIHRNYYICTNNWQMIARYVVSRGAACVPRRPGVPIHGKQRAHLPSRLRILSVLDWSRSESYYGIVGWYCIALWEPRGSMTVFGSQFTYVWLHSICDKSSPGISILRIRSMFAQIERLIHCNAIVLG